MVKKILGVSLLVLLVLVTYYWSLISYGIGQGMGQLKIIRGARPVEEFLADPGFPDSLKTKLQLIRQARQFAIDSLGLNDTENYTTLYDQKGEELMWLVIASEQFRLVEKRWDFPIIGSFPYKGFFLKEKAQEERAMLESAGWDVSIRNAGGWSTLGWLNDPILSGMLRQSEGDLVSTIIHEMVHETIFVKDSSEFNENLASFIGDRGAEHFLLRALGDTSRQYQEYIHHDDNYRKVIDHFLRGTKSLDSLYQTMTEEEPIESKKARKERAIRRIVETFDTISYGDGKRRQNRFGDRLPNNAFFIAYRTYESKHDAMLEEWNGRFDKDLKKMISYYRKAYPSL